MPWLAGTALLHSAVVMEKREALKIWTILLAIMTFSLSLVGTFLVRSGILTSVHTFASDPARGVFILAILITFHRRRAGALCLAGADHAAGRPVCAGVARGRAIAQQSVPDHRLRHRVRRHALSARARSLDRRKDFGRRAVLQPHLRAVVHPAAGGGAVRAAARLETRRPSRRRAAAHWRDLHRSHRRCRNVRDRGLSGAAGARHRTCALRDGRARSPISSSARRSCARHSPSRCSAPAACRVRTGAPRSRISGSARCCSASSAMRSGEPSASFRSNPSEKISLRQYDFTFEGLTTRTGPNYREVAAKFSVHRHGEVDRRARAVQAHVRLARHHDDGGRADDARLQPALCVARRSAGRRRAGGAHLSQAAGAADLVRAVADGLGGALSLSDRRLRVGAPRPAKARAALQPAE